MARSAVASCTASRRSATGGNVGFSASPNHTHTRGRNAHGSFRSAGPRPKLKNPFHNPLMAVGITLTFPVAPASARSTPRPNGYICPLRVSLPSGNITTSSPAESASEICFRLRPAACGPLPMRMVRARAHERTNRRKGLR
jgi:hypothetical protein